MIEGLYELRSLIYLIISIFYKNGSVRIEYFVTKKKKSETRHYLNIHNNGIVLSSTQNNPVDCRFLDYILPQENEFRNVGQCEWCKAAYATHKILVKLWIFHAYTQPNQLLLWSNDCTHTIGKYNQRKVKLIFVNSAFPYCHARIRLMENRRNQTISLHSSLSLFTKIM